ncbi:MAG: 6-bladed beta-propeller [Rikenellaceae bacterium]|nr:6-bladed beta-propeller [Rikenellaceae bacterium]
MKRLTLFYLGLLLLAFCGCRGGGGAVADVKYYIVPEQTALDESTRFSDLLEEYRYIIPEATKESYFAYIFKAYIYRDRIYLFDKENQSKILVFDLNNGQFIRGIGYQGRGPNEYVTLTNFTLDKERGEVLILDEATDRVLIYDADSGAFKGLFELGFTARNIEYLDENTLAYVGGGEDADRLRLSDRAGNEIGSWIPAEERNGMVIINAFSRGTGNELVFKTFLSDSLYTVTPQGPVVSRFVDFGEDALTWSKFMSHSPSERNEMIRHLESYRTYMKYYAETDSHIWFLYSEKNTPWCTVYNKETGQTYNYSIFTPNNVVFDKYAPLISASDDNYFIGTNDAYSIVENIEQTSPSDIPDDLKALTTNDNPVITLLKFK